MGLNIIKNYLTKNDCYRSGRTITPIGIQIHTIGTAQNTAKSLADYWNQSGISACVHYAVDAEVEGDVLQFLPEHYRSWADAGYGNNNLITMEGMESDYMQYTGGASYDIKDMAKFKEDIKRSYNGLVLLCTQICKERGWNPTTKLPSGLYLISSHNEGREAGLSSDHSDPDHVWSKLGYTMDGFRNAVKAKLTENAALKTGMKIKTTEAIFWRTSVSTKAKPGGYVKFENLTASGKTKSTKKGKRAKFKKGNTIQILEVKVNDIGDTWVRVKNGWLPMIVGGKGRYTVV